MAILEDDETAVSRHRGQPLVDQQPTAALLPAVALASVASAACSYFPLANRATAVTGLALAPVITVAKSRESSRFAHALDQFNLLSKSVLIEFSLIGREWYRSPISKVL